MKSKAACGSVSNDVAPKLNGELADISRWLSDDLETILACVDELAALVPCGEDRDRAVAIQDCADRSFLGAVRSIRMLKQALASPVSAPPLMLDDEDLATPPSSERKGTAA